MTRTCGASIRPIPTCPEEGYRYAEREKIESLINEHTRAIMVTNPGNLTGVGAEPRGDGDAFVDVAQKHDLFLIGDEAYRESVYGGEKLQSFGEFAGQGGDNIIVIDTAPSAFRLRRARIGCLISKNKRVHEPRDEILPLKTGRDARPDRVCRALHRRPRVFCRCARRV